jgi:hypothetical protein
MALKRAIFAYILGAFASNVIILFGFGLSLSLSKIFERDSTYVNEKSLFNYSQFISGVDILYTILHIFVFFLFLAFLRKFFRRFKMGEYIGFILIYLLAILITEFAISLQSQLNILGSFNRIHYDMVLYAIVMIFIYSKTDADLYDRIIQSFAHAGLFTLISLVLYHFANNFPLQFINELKLSLLIFLNSYFVILAVYVLYCAFYKAELRE